LSTPVVAGVHRSEVTRGRPEGPASERRRPEPGEALAQNVSAALASAMPGQLRTTTATRGDVDRAVECASREGWNRGLDDAAAFRAADPEGFLVGRIGDEPVSWSSVVGYPGGFGFLGFYIVVPERRGRGHGVATWRAGLQRLGERT